MFVESAGLSLGAKLKIFWSGVVCSNSNSLLVASSSMSVGVFASVPSVFFWRRHSQFGLLLFFQFRQKSSLSLLINSRVSVFFLKN